MELAVHPGPPPYFAILGLSMTAIPPLNLPEEAREHWLRGFLGWAGTWRRDPLVLFVSDLQARRIRIGPM